MIEGKRGGSREGGGEGGKRGGWKWEEGDCNILENCCKGCPATRTWSRAQTPPTLTRRRVWYSSSNFWGLVQNSGKPIRIVPCDLDD